jgi:hypothetical protein
MGNMLNNLFMSKIRLLSSKDKNLKSKDRYGTKAIIRGSMAKEFMLDEHREIIDGKPHKA